MNNRFLTIVSLLASSKLFLAGCSGDNSSFETPNINAEITTNPGVVSQRNFEVGAVDPFPLVVDLDNNQFIGLTVDIVVQIGDQKNQLVTDEHTVFFKTQWGLIQPSCVTVDGGCSVEWRTSKFENIPATNTNIIVAWTVGEESFNDTNGNGIFDDADTTFEDLEEPFLDINLDGVFDGAGGDKLIDVVNGNDLTGINGVHDIGDTFLNSPNCTNASLCSTVRPLTYVWNSAPMILTGPPDPPATP